MAHGIERVLAAATDEFEVIAACHSGQETLEVAAGRRPDLVLLDVRLGDMNGSDVCRQLGTDAPRSKVVMLTAFDDTENLRRCLEAGAAGVLLKGTLDLDLIQALRDVRDGQMVIDAGIARALEVASGILTPNGTTVPQLRPREVDVLRLM
ncbi:MAG TPA: response regulator transcription factor, partial [Pseudonocardia sp.]